MAYCLPLDSLLSVTVGRYHSMYTSGHTAFSSTDTAQVVVPEKHVLTEAAVPPDAMDNEKSGV